MKLLVGLGNPGAQYAMTRHNAGFIILDLLAEEEKLTWRDEARFSSTTAKGSFLGLTVMLQKPTTYMNRSGFAVGNLLRFLKLKPADMIVFHDDIDLPAGKVRVREGGGHGGHNGIRSIIDEVGDSNFYRIKLGVGRPNDAQEERRESVSNWVLGKMSELELQTLRTTMLTEAKLRLKGILDKSVS